MATRRPKADGEEAGGAEAGGAQAGGGEAGGGDPEGGSGLLPIRSVNAHTFCPRLFWLEEKAGLFVHNEHTLEGAHVHRRVSKPGGAMAAPPPRSEAHAAGQDDDAPWHTRDLWLSSKALGVSGKIDLVDASTGGSGAVMPVDTKKGRPPQDHGAPELWPADQVQLGLQALLLEEAGYAVTEIAGYYRAARRRVVVPLTDEVREQARAAVAASRETRARAEPPPPLVDSPKCRGCSLNVLCQPDEVNALTGRSAWSPGREIRRVVPMGTDARPLVVATPGARVGVSRRSLTVRPPDGAGEQQKVGLAQVAQVALVGTAQISTQALRACLEAGVPVTFSSTGGRVYGIAVGDESRAVYVRMAQHRSVGPDGPGLAAMAIARTLIADKIANQRTMLRRNAALDAEDGDLRRLRRLVDLAADAGDPGVLLAREGEAGKRYWRVFSKLCARDEPGFRMQGRTRRPPRDATNAMVSFASGLLTRDCLLAVRAAGLDAYLGVFHTPQHGRPSMALDLMEPFRPLIVDSVVLGMIRRGEVSIDGFAKTGQAVAMKQHTRLALIRAYERRLAEEITHPLFRYRITYRQTLSVHARLLARTLVGELSAMPSFRTR